eukprot:358558-Amphidinium_carterae.1
MTSMHQQRSEVVLQQTLISLKVSTLDWQLIVQGNFSQFLWSVASPQAPPASRARHGLSNGLCNQRNKTRRASKGDEGINVVKVERKHESML